jgi:hypothetical protein
MKLPRLARRLFMKDRSWSGWFVIALKLIIFGMSIALGLLIYRSIVTYPVYLDVFRELMSLLKRKEYEPTLWPFYALLLLPILGRHLKWLILPTLIAGLSVGTLKTRSAGFHPSHLIKLHNSFSLAELAQEEEMPYFRVCLLPLMVLRPYLKGATLTISPSTSLGLDDFLLHSVALVRDVITEQFNSQLTADQAERILRRPNFRKILYNACPPEQTRFVTVGPNPAKHYRVYTYQQDLVLVEEGYVIE